MSYYELLFSLGISFLGIVLFFVSRSLNTVEEDEWKRRRWFSEMLYGPPGYYRAAIGIFGVFLTIFGAIGFFRFLLLFRN